MLLRDPGNTASTLMFSNIPVVYCRARSVLHLNYFSCFSCVFHFLFFGIVVTPLGNTMKCALLLFGLVQINFMSSLYSNGLGHHVADDAVMLIWTEIIEDGF